MGPISVVEDLNGLLGVDPAHRVILTAAALALCANVRREPLNAGVEPHVERADVKRSERVRDRAIVSADGYRVEPIERSLRPDRRYGSRRAALDGPLSDGVRGQRARQPRPHVTLHHHPGQTAGHARSTPVRNPSAGYRWAMNIRKSWRSTSTRTPRGADILAVGAPVDLRWCALMTWAGALRSTAEVRHECAHPALTHSSAPGWEQAVGAPAEAPQGCVDLLKVGRRPTSEPNLGPRSGR